MGSVARRRDTVDTGVDAVLARRPATGDWLATLPAAPADTHVTVSLSDPAAVIRFGAELASRGYDPVGAAGCSADAVVTADFLVPRAAVFDAPAWFQALIGPDGKAYEPSLGPVRLLLGPILAAHREAMRGRD